ncbi:hypothetical protein [Streptomyces sp. NPDC051162]|uniref:hypothetical protein n=1 Tax=unclassified Streptomyces TaxID=2593676 RepID=UPI003417DC9F
MITLTAPDRSLRRTSALTAARAAALLPPGWYEDLHVDEDGNIHIRPTVGAGHEALTNVLSHPALQGWQLAEGPEAMPCAACTAL